MAAAATKTDSDRMRLYRIVITSTKYEQEKLVSSKENRKNIRKRSIYSYCTIKHNDKYNFNF